MQLLDSLLSTLDDAPASLPHHQRLAWMAPQPPPPALLPGSFQGAQVAQSYGSLLRQPHVLASSMPRMAAGGAGSRPSSSIDYGGHNGGLGSYGGGGGYGLAAAYPLPARPATSGAVHRSTAEWGRMSAAEREEAGNELRVWAAVKGAGCSVS